MGRIIGIDYGKVRIGFAISDENAIIAQPKPFIPAGKTLKETARRLAEEISKHSPSTIVIGLPLHMSGKESPMSEEVRKLVPLLEELCQTQVVLWDERLSTAQIERELKMAEVSRKKRTPIIDSLTATLILQNFLDRSRM